MRSIDEALIEMRQKRSGLKNELKLLEGNIATLQKAKTVVDGYDLSLTEAPEAIQVQRTRRGGGGVVVTTEVVRDAVLHLSETGSQRRDKFLLPGYFTRMDVTNLLGCAQSNPKVTQALNELAEKGVLENVPYKGRGVQYKYAALPNGPTEHPRTEITAAPPVERAPVANLGKFKANKDIQLLLDASKLAGMDVQISGSNHYLVFDPRTGKKVSVPGTPSDRRSILNVKKNLRNLGVRV